MQFHTLFAVLALQTYAAIHALQRGYSFPVAALIFFVPLLGPMAYFAYESGPSLYYRWQRNIRKSLAFVKFQPSPFKELAKLQRQVKYHPTIDNQHRLAKIYQQTGHFNDAIMLMDNILSQRTFAHCPYLLLDKAQIYFAMEDFDKTKMTLAFLLEKNPGVESPHAQLLLARTLSAQGEWQQANREFERLQSRYHGLEASFYFLQHLRKLDNKPRAHEVLNHMRNQFQRLPQHHRSSQKAWLKQAEKERS